MVFHISPGGECGGNRVVHSGLSRQRLRPRLPRGDRQAKKPVPPKVP